MKTTKNKKKTAIAEIEKAASKGKDVTEHFNFSEAKIQKGLGSITRVEKTNSVQRVNVDFAQPMLAELDIICRDLNVPRQSLIKTMVRREMDQYLANKKLRKA